MQEGEQKKRSIFRIFTRKVLLLINFAFILLLFTTYLAAYISPKYIWWMSLFALAYGIILSTNLFFIALWLILKKKYFLYSLIAVLIGFSRLLGIFQFRFTKPSQEPRVQTTEHLPLKVMSYNVHVFDLYNWFNNHQVRWNMLQYLKHESPDIVGFQEFFSSSRKNYKFENAEALKTLLPAPYAHIHYTVDLHDGDHWGIATYSKYPIINKQVVHFDDPKGNIFIYSDIVAGIDTFRVFNVHLESDRFEPADYRFVKEFDIGPHEDSKVKGAWKRVVSIVKRLKKSAVKRAEQAALMAGYIAESPYPVIICGDFNDTPSSYTYSVLKDNLKDAFRESGHGFGKTYLGAFPSFRIDFLLHDKRIESSGFRTGNVDYSDHYPISCIMQKEE